MNLRRRREALISSAYWSGNASLPFTYGPIRTMLHSQKKIPKQDELDLPLNDSGLLARLPEKLLPAKGVGLPALDPWGVPP